MDGGGRGRGKGEKTEEIVGKQNTPSVVARHCVYGDEQVNELN